MHTASRKDVVRALGARHALGTQAHQGKVRSTAADVGNQHQLFAVDLGFVFECCRDRLVLEGHFAETDAARDFPQGVFSQLVGSLVVIDEMDRGAPAPRGRNGGRQRFRRGASLPR